VYALPENRAFSHLKASYGTSQPRTVASCGHLRSEGSVEGRAKVQGKKSEMAVEATRPFSMQTDEPYHLVYVHCATRFRGVPGSIPFPSPGQSFPPFNLPCEKLVVARRTVPRGSWVVDRPGHDGALVPLARYRNILLVIRSAYYAYADMSCRIEKASSRGARGNGSAEK
jgi:hypothetical protein